MKNKELNQLIEKILDYARPLEKARINYLLFNGLKSDVIKELLRFQNEDGGFGHALEPDLWNPNSSPIQTWVATGILKELTMDKDDPIIQSILSYLESSFDTHINRWLRLYPDNDLYPHAPWWSYRVIQEDFNPSASLAGFILIYSNPNALVYQYALNVVVDTLAFVKETKEPIEMHELSAILEMANDILLTSQKQLISDEIKDALIKHVDVILEKDPSKWFTSYCAKPTSLIHSHPSIGSDQYFNLILKEFEIALKSRNDEGVWPVTWQWGSYPKEYEKACSMWTGIIGFRYLSSMVLFEYIKK